MYSKAKIAGHPLHPMLVVFPIALYTATVACLLVYTVAHDVFWFRAAMTANMAGVVMAIIAVIPGVIDLFVAIPRDTPARTTGYKHAGLNGLANVLFLCSAVLLGGEWADRDRSAAVWDFAIALPLGLAVVGLLCTLIAGWFGWRLVQSYHVGIDEEDLIEIYDDELPPLPPPIPRAALEDRVARPRSASRL
jgi:uncharacterized membrane protein